MAARQDCDADQTFSHGPRELSVRQIEAESGGGSISSNLQNPPTSPQECPVTNNLSKESVDRLPEDSDSEVYSVFTITEKRIIVLLVAMAGFFSPFSAFIYFPALKTIAKSLSVSLELINITVTMYLVVQGIVPSIFGDLSEGLGRRPVYLLVFIIYIAASIGLACQNSYPGLLVLRMLQSAGSSGTIALAYGVISDIAAPHERGGYVGLAHIGFNSGPSLGPVIGGALTELVGWRWVFWFLVCLSALVFLLLAFLLPETNRLLVGNGRARATGLNLSLLKRINIFTHHTNQDGLMMQRPMLRVPNPLVSLRLIFHRETAIILLINALFYMKYSCVQASLGSLFQDIYGLTVFQSGLCYLAFGFACAIASWGLDKSLITTIAGQRATTI